MKLLQPIAPLIHQILREQVYSSEEKYRCPTFVFNMYISEGILSYNLLTKELVFYKNLQEEREELVKKWFLVPEYFQEFEFVTNIKQLIKSLCYQNGDVLNYTIFTTTDCNARCYYCFEKPFSKVRMSQKVMLATADFIKTNYCNKKNILHWFGGEPLYNVTAIDRICGILNESGVEFESRMTSNGLLFNKRLIERANDKWHMKDVQITLDGTKDKYNQIKAYISQEPNPFGIVLDNVRNLLEAGIQVTIRLNLSQDNCSDLIELVEMLGKLFSKYDICDIYAMPLFDNVQDAEKRKIIFTKLLALNKSIDENRMDLGYAYFSKVRLNHCKADSNLKSVIIYPDGNIGLCEHKWESKYIGNVYKPNLMDKNEISKWERYSMPLDKCSVCCLYPDCLKLEKCDMNSECFLESIEYDKYLIRKQMLKKYKSYETEI